MSAAQDRSPAGDVRLEHPCFDLQPWPQARWGADDRPVAIVDGEVHRVRELRMPLRGAAAYVVGAGDSELAQIARQITVETLHFYELRAADLAPLREVPQLRNLKISWNTKLTTLDSLAGLTGLECLALEHTPKVTELAPLTALPHLRALQFAGGMWTPNRARTLAPLAELAALEELALGNLRVDVDGLRPLAKCRSLRRLFLSNQFSTEDYAYLSVALPDVRCEFFAPWVQVRMSDGRTAMVVGKGKPVLDPVADADRLTRYEAAFVRLQARFRAERAG